MEIHNQILETVASIIFTTLIYEFMEDKAKLTKKFVGVIFELRWE